VRIVYSSGIERQNPTVIVAGMRLMIMKGTSLSKSDVYTPETNQAKGHCHYVLIVRIL